MSDTPVDKPVDKNVINTYTDPVTGKFVPGNPGSKNGGRPKGSLSLSTIMKRKLKEIDPKTGKTYAEVLIEKVAKKAIEDEDNKMIELIWSYIDGKPVAKVEGDINITTFRDFVASLYGEQGDSEEVEEGPDRVDEVHVAGHLPVGEAEGDSPSTSEPSPSNG